MRAPNEGRTTAYLKVDRTRHRSFEDNRTKGWPKACKDIKPVKCEHSAFRCRRGEAIHSVACRTAK